MAVGEQLFPAMPEVGGIRLGTACAGIRQNERDDLVVVEMQEGSACSAVFTRNAFCAAPVEIARDHLQNTPRWLLINSGNANAGTGNRGRSDALETCSALSEGCGGVAGQVLPFSTGVIGEFLPLEAIRSAIPTACARLSGRGWRDAARAIMTTDTREKGSTRRCEIDGREVIINGIAKGSGMIHPDMATMLAFVATDASVSPQLLQRCLQDAVSGTFNRISVDGDTSTNDACVLIATGASGVDIESLDSGDGMRFRDRVREVCAELAEQIVTDGEGATRVLRIQVEQAASDEEALCVARTIATSPLVKTALFAADPNWGRILAAVGRAPVDGLYINAVEIWLGDLPVVSHGGVAEEYSEARAAEIMSRDQVKLLVILGRGTCAETCLTCDLSYDYVRINAEYRS